MNGSDWNNLFGAQLLVCDANFSVVVPIRRATSESSMNLLIEAFFSEPSKAARI
jgi:hypothetical protein